MKTIQRYPIESAIFAAAKMFKNDPHVSDLDILDWIAETMRCQQLAGNDVDMNYSHPFALQRVRALLSRKGKI